MTKLIVVLVNWQRPADTIECIQSIKQAGVPVGDILLVDNGSQDMSVEQIMAVHPGLMVELLPHNLGFAGGYNKGIEVALTTDASHIFLLNNDTVIDPKAIMMLLASDWDVAIPKILYYDKPDLIWSAGARWRIFPPALIMNGYSKPDGPRYDISGRLSYATGCAILAKREVFTTVGGFDQDFVNYMEDYDFFFRVLQTGYQVGYVPQARIFHKVSASLGQLSPIRWHYLGRSTVLFYKKDKRFQSWMLWSYLGWFFTRELIKGNAKNLPAFWEGYKEGLASVNNKEKAQYGTEK